MQKGERVYMDEIKSGFFQKVVLSFYNFDLYKKVVYEGMKKAIIYLILLSLFLSIFTAINPVRDYLNLIDDFEDILLNDLPDFVIQDGKLLSESDELIIKDFGGLAIIFDPGNKKDESVLTNYISGIYINDKKLVQRSIIYQNISFENFSGINITKKDIIKMFPLLRYLSILLALLFFIADFIGKLISVLLLSLIITPVKNRYMPNFQFSDCMKLSVYAMTPAFVFGSIIAVMGLQTDWLYFIIFYGSGIFYANKAFKELNKFINNE
jgi:hypothetical protein